ncbi:MAG TPA: ABC transporter substrate-binding protein [Casimicrobiaceae bacterium]|nr:ABC transporter substrate-binding protein [Casimicrobiaceae bacterium]
MRRRTVLSVVLTLIPARVAGQGQPTARVYRIGWLGSAPLDARTREAFVDGLREHGWIEGKNVTVEALYSDGRNDRFPALALELVKRSVDVIVASGTPPAEAARDATTSIPIVFVYVGDPVGAGLVDSPARPGRNLTGLGGFAAGFYTKQLALLKEVLPKATRIGLFINDTLSLHIALRGELEAAARKLGVILVPVQVNVPEDIDIAFATIAKQRVDALFIAAQPMISAQRARVVKLALDQRMPVVSAFDQLTEAGLLLSYASRFVDDVRRAPYFIDRIFRGAKPADLPVEQPTRVYLSVNLKTAKAIGVPIPASVLARADQVFE